MTCYITLERLVSGFSEFSNQKLLIKGYNRQVCQSLRHQGKMKDDIGTELSFYKDAQSNLIAIRIFPRSMNSLIETAFFTTLNGVWI